MNILNNNCFLIYWLPVKIKKFKVFIEKSVDYIITWSLSNGIFSVLQRRLLVHNTIPSLCERTLSSVTWSLIARQQGDETVAG